MELIDSKHVKVQHCHETVRPTNVQDFHSKFVSKIYNAPHVITQNFNVI